MAHAKNLGEIFMAHLENLYNIPCGIQNFHPIVKYIILLHCSILSILVMAKKITQDTFDSVVHENLDEFEMEINEAITDAIQQFTAQVSYL